MELGSYFSFRIIDCVRETINEQEEELLPLISVIYKEKTDGNQEGRIIAVSCSPIIVFNLCIFPNFSEIP